VTGINRDPRLEFVFLAKSLKPSFPGGSLLDVSELGLHDVLVPGAFPATIRLWVVGRLQWREEDKGKQFHVSYAVRAWKATAAQPALGDDAFTPDVSAEQPSPYPHHEASLLPAQFLSPLTITLPGYGTYVVEVLLDDEVIASAPFAVLPPQGLS
jgi:hypothetical protein